MLLQPKKLQQNQLTVSQPWRQPSNHFQQGWNYLCAFECRGFLHHPNMFLRPIGFELLFKKIKAPNHQAESTRDEKDQEILLSQPVGGLFFEKTFGG